MAEDRYSWLDKDAAERILRGEPVDARRGPGARELAEFLRAAADAGADMSAAPSGADTSADSGGSVAFTEPGARGVGRSPLPGEEAALAAFREARERGAFAAGAATAGVTAEVTAGSTAGALAGTSGAPRGAEDTYSYSAGEAGTLGAVVGGAARPERARERTRLGRPFRRGFVAALACCTLGGVAVAAGAGVLPGPFRSGGDAPGPAPASSVSAVVSPDPYGTRGSGTAPGEVSKSPDPTVSDTTPSGTDSSGGEGPRGPGPDGDGGSARGDGKHGRDGGRERDTDTRRGKVGDGSKDEGEGKDEDEGRGKSRGGREFDGREIVISLCRAYEAGELPRMEPNMVRRLERSAGGPERVRAFCRAFLERNHPARRVVRTVTAVLPLARKVDERAVEAILGASVATIPGASVATARETTVERTVVPGPPTPRPHPKPAPRPHRRRVPRPPGVTFSARPAQ